MKNCPNCQKDFEPKSGKQKFCSDKCKVAFARKTAKELGVKTAAEIEPKKEIITVWVKEVEDFCNANSCTYKDLIEAYKTWNSRMQSTAMAIKNQPKVTVTTSASYLSERWKKKMGIKPPKS